MPCPDTMKKLSRLPEVVTLLIFILEVSSLNPRLNNDNSGLPDTFVVFLSPFT